MWKIIIFVKEFGFLCFHYPDALFYPVHFLPSIFLIIEGLLALIVILSRLAGYGLPLSRELICDCDPLR